MTHRDVLTFFLQRNDRKFPTVQWISHKRNDQNTAITTCTTATTTTNNNKNKNGTFVMLNRLVA